ncbi:Homeodomain-like protein [Cynara cardunculus var. scolymus]|uniref:Homeodomain-like protein n=1 Tax=Cynara cardunculus var. scolymus TaxID=59895 RepID=A0A103XEH7_CYNCS|nr:Homeodomain-like protein [Cynara cardunculus var. scolymus]
METNGQKLPHICREDRFIMLRIFAIIIKLKWPDFTRKGPWKIEEDELLIKHVEEYGPRDWDLPLSKGHLQRTGKSCRKYGNKWAKNATYLTGRSVYHVKNVWYNHQTKMARFYKGKTECLKFSSCPDKKRKRKRNRKRKKC